MTSLPSNISRIPQMLSQQLLLSNLGRSNTGLLDVQTQLSTGRRVNRVSDDPVAASVITSLNDRLGRNAQYQRSTSHASSVLSQLDTALNEVTNTVREAQSIAQGQIGVTSSAGERAQQAQVVDSLISSLFNTVNTQPVPGLYAFGGSTPGQPPVERFGGGFRFTARGAGLVTDLGLGERIPITIGGSNAVGETSARLTSLTVLNPNVTPQTRIADLRGARGLGVTNGTVQFSFNGGPAQTIDLGTINSAEDVRSKIESAIRAYETSSGTTVLTPTGVQFGAQGLTFNVAAGGSLVFSDINNATVAADLGLTTAPFTPAAPLGGSLAPKLTPQTTLASIPALTLPLGTIRVKATGSNVITRDIDLSGAATIDDISSKLESAGVGARVTIADSGDRLVVQNEVAGQILSIEETSNGTSATQLGIRTFSAQTPLSDFNYGRGVRIIDNVNDPTTGTPTPALNRDFKVTLGNGQAFYVDLRPSDMTSVSSVIARINTEFNTAVGQPPVNASAPPLTATDFLASIVNGKNGIAFSSPYAGGIIVTGENNSAAAEDLGLTPGTPMAFDSASSAYIAQDRSGIRVNNLFSDLIDLRNALTRDDSAGITVAGSGLQANGDRVITAQGLVGSYAKRVEDGQRRLEDQQTFDEQVKSQLQDVDFAEAASKLSLLQTQLQATYQVAGKLNGRTLLDFLS
jgi:flagellar hook-associated protein 3 FlgL